MRLLLDTQVMLWWLLDDPRLGTTTRALGFPRNGGHIGRSRDLTTRLFTDDESNP